MSTDLRKIYETIRDHQEFALGFGIPLRLMKLSEEVGEVNAAFFGYLGANARKGITHDREAVARELYDVAITALVAAHDWTDDPVGGFEDAIRRVVKRCEEQGS